MIDNNAKAPSKRSGDDMNPVLANIIKYTLAAVAVALVVLATLITIQLIKAGKEKESIFKDTIKLSYVEFSNILDADYDKNNLTNENGLRDLVTKADPSKEIYFYFYRSSLEKNISKEAQNIIKKIDNKESLIFFVDLDIPKAAGEEQPTSNQFEDFLKSDNKSLSKLPMNVTMKADKDGKYKYETFIISFIEDKIIDDEQFKLIRESKEILDVLNGMTMKEEEKK